MKVENMNVSGDETSILEVGDADFESVVLRARQPVLVGFWAVWSRPCRVLNATLKRVAAACAGSVKVVRINADDHPDLSLCYDVQSIPTLLYFEGGELRARLVGTASEAAILAKLRTVTRLDSPLAPADPRDENRQPRSLSNSGDNFNQAKP